MNSKDGLKYEQRFMIRRDEPRLMNQGLLKDFFQ